MRRGRERKKSAESTPWCGRAGDRGARSVTRDSLEKIKQRLTRLAARQELFTTEDFPPPAPGGKLKSCLYRSPRRGTTALRCTQCFARPATARRRTTTPTWR